MSAARRALAAPLVALALGALVAPPARAQRVERGERLRAMQEEIVRLERELASLGTSERGLLGELERLGAELRLREATAERLALRREELGAAIADRDATVSSLEERQRTRSAWLAFRAREIYKDGPTQALRRLLGGDAARDYLAGLRYAAYLGERDAAALRAYRSDAERLGRERGELERERSELAAAERELAGAVKRLEAVRGERARRLDVIRDDRSRRATALAELREAADALGELAGSLGPGRAPALDVRKFRGLLDWPASGKVIAGFGSIVHPRFKTSVPHPGLDIAGSTGDEIRSVFDGSVVFASWLRGYGLTAIVDHGNGLLSVYAHASVLLVEAGETVLRGQRIGLIGDTGSLQGPFLYFELRLDGRPADPAGWLRPR